MAGRKPCSIEERFWEKVDRVSDPNGCWIWTAYCDPRSGYGRFRVVDPETGKHRSIEAMRVAWELVRGPLGPGECALHQCDNPPCVKVTTDPATSHIFKGTKAENNADRDAKGRRVDAQLRGDDHPCSRLSSAIVRKLRSDWASGVYRTQREAAVMLGVSRPQIGNILRGQSWASVV